MNDIEDMNRDESEAKEFAIEIRKVIKATPERVFNAWTRAEHLLKWWGPGDVTCPEADIDLRVGGAYRIANLLPDGKTVVISGEFILVDPPNKLIYTWHVEPGPDHPERVTVTFTGQEDSTEIVVFHERILSETMRDQHTMGWTGCFEGLVTYLED